jgi:hypothetical protein
MRCVCCSDAREECANNERKRERERLENNERRTLIIKMSMAHLDVLARSVRNERVHGEMFVTCGVLTFFPKFGCILCALIPTTTNNVCESYSSVVVRCSHSRSRGERVVEEEIVKIIAVQSGVGVFRNAKSGKNQSKTKRSGRFASATTTRTTKRTTRRGKRVLRTPARAAGARERRDGIRDVFERFESRVRGSERVECRRGV